MCLVCDRIGQIRRGENPYFVRELKSGYVVIGDHQHFYGYTLFLYKNHVLELHHLAREEKLTYLEEMSLVAEAAVKAFDAEKMNCELLGNGDAHLHWHLFPRRSGDLGAYARAGPVWWLPKNEMYAEGNRPAPEELENMKRRLNAALDSLLNEKEVCNRAY